MDNKICKKCGKPYHYCEGCGFIFEHEFGYCSYECIKEFILYTKDLYSKHGEYEDKSVFKHTNEDLYIIKFKNCYQEYNLNDGTIKDISLNFDSGWIFIYVEKGETI